MSSAKSKESKQKNRRWSYVITSNSQSFQLPVLCYGNSKKANEVKDRIHADYKENVEALKTVDFIVEKIPHETISITTQQQLDGMELENKILKEALRYASEDFHNPKILQSTLEQPEEVKSKTVGEWVVKAKRELAKEYYPEGAGKAIDSAIDAEVARLAEMGYKLDDEVANGDASE